MKNKELFVETMEGINNEQREYQFSLRLLNQFLQIYFVVLVMLVKALFTEDC